jgi:hypothetical protein
MSLLASLAASVLVSLAGAAPATAGGDLSVAPERPEQRVIRHYVYRPHYVHEYHGDPYAYRYVRRGYYPYYGSHYWVPAEQMRYRYRYTYEGPKYRYQPSWGRPKAEHHVPAPSGTVILK